uniref:Plastid lipid-associated protein/fibrillin conserved domain-containing protein n=1 Tax=Hemiselmis andersenii TaxID=464988 RepID=A0A6T8MXP1_HEMAN|mmetsp:Transcript_14482/g.35233  ORF Transcript_14482/g.35233 Transcript_14482/m.35233 type:complete len:255 (-) Transcript_14482:10-774(-)
MAYMMRVSTALFLVSCASAFSFAPLHHQLRRAARETGVFACRTHLEGGDGKQYVDRLVQSQSSNPVGGPFGNAGAFELRGKDAGIEAWLASAGTTNPTADPGQWDSDDKAKRLAEGVWEVCYAPHISVMQQVLQTKFSPIRYNLVVSEGGERRIISNVRYDSAAFGQGWLNTDGRWESIDKNTVRIVWKKFWWDIKRDTPSPVPEEEQAGWVQALGSLAFLPVFSTFPVRYVDGDTCAFDFAPTNSCIVARKVG